MIKAILRLWTHNYVQLAINLAPFEMTLILVYIIIILYVILLLYIPLKTLTIIIAIN